MSKHSNDIIEFPVNVDDKPSNALTGIHGSIHWPTTRTDVEAGYDELDRIDIDNFLDTLAAVALSIAARETTI